ncbi:MAG: universal stress protein [Burkholderiales bacterium]|jgi:nucleotide-binding universal stress UspA family protein|nr:universal stress protein [Burkholderiales bacterium]
MKILAATDGSKYALRAIKQAAALLANNKDKTNSITLISVHDDAGLRHAQSFVGKAAITDYLREQSDKDLKSAMKVLNDAGIKHDQMILVGKPAAEIVEAAQKGKYDLVVLGSKGRNAVSDLLLGSVAQRVMSLSKQSVLLVK